jgi:hypothetical protein
LKARHRELIINATVLVVAFTVMMAALMYDPSKDDGEGVKGILVQGFVTDEGGRPISSAVVVADTLADERYDVSVQCEADTDPNGYYVMTVDRGAQLSLFVYADTEADNVYWTEKHVYGIADDPPSIVSNFTLQRSMSASVPLGIAVVIDTLAPSTHASISLDPQLLELLIEIRGTGSSVDRAQVVLSDPSLDLGVTGGGSMMLYMNATVCGTYDGTGRITNLFFLQTGELRAVPVDLGTLDGTASEAHTIIDLSQGEVHEVTAVRGGVAYSLPGGLDRSFSFTLLGSEVTARLIGIGYTYGTNESSVTVTFGPADGNGRSYDASVIGGYIISVREIDRVV